MEDSFGIPAELGEHQYTIRPQRHAYLRRKLSKLADSLTDMNVAEGETADVANSLFDLLEDRAYEVLKVFIPDLMPQWEFEGYGSKESMENDSYDEDADRSPSMPQITNAFRQIVKVNDFDWVGQLKNFIGPDLIRAQMRSFLATQAMNRNSSRTLPSSQPTNGASDQTSSGTAEPTTPEALTSDSPTADS